MDIEGLTLTPSPNSARRRLDTCGLLSIYPR